MRAFAEESQPCDASRKRNVERAALPFADGR